MSNPIFQTKQGLDAVCTGARFRGELVLNDESEYGGIEWLDVRPKPDWNTVEAAALLVLRYKIASKLNTRTSEMITNDFHASISPETVVVSTTEWQFDTMNLWLIRDMGLVAFPYELHVGMNEDATSRYITIPTPDDLQQIYLEMFGHISTCLASGRVEKDKLHSMTRTQLEEYRDNR